MQSAEVVILAMVSILAIVGLVMYSPVSTEGAIIAKPIMGDECVQMSCPDGLMSAKIKEYNGYVYCACGQYTQSEDYGQVFNYQLSQGDWKNS